MPFFNTILIKHNLFFLYPTIFPSQFEPLFGLPKDTFFCWRFLKPFNKLAGRVLSVYKATRFLPVAFYPDKTLRLVY